MGHIHAAAMAEYAKDAIETDMPWERWEVSVTESGDEYRNLLGHPDWAVTRKYRRKPKVILINGHEVPEPLPNTFTRWYELLDSWHPYKCNPISLAR